MDRGARGYGDQIVRSIIAENRDDRIRIDFQANSQNVGVVANLATAMRQAAGCDYLTFCEGDDFWCSKHRIQEHIDFRWPARYRDIRGRRVQIG